jgi:hypothetical protein
MEQRRDDTLIEILIAKVDALDTKLDRHMEEESKKIGELTEAFATAKHVVSFVKWSAAIIGALALSWVFIKEHFLIGLK